jgi:hypothetical protein
MWGFAGGPEALTEMPRLHAQASTFARALARGLRLLRRHLNDVAGSDVREIDACVVNDDGKDLA